MAFNFTPLENQDETIRVPFIEDARAAAAETGIHEPDADAASEAK